jgi:hypothetical protein
MMMECLIKGGMNAFWDNSQNIINTYCENKKYIPNPNGFYALNFNFFNSSSFIKDFDNKLIKCPYDLLLKLPDHKYKLIFMIRNPEEIRKSMRSVSPYHTWGRNETITWLYEKIFEALINNIQERKDIDILVINYLDIINNPKMEFEKIKNNGWNIDIKKSSSVVNKSLYRNKVR